MPGLSEEEDIFGDASPSQLPLSQATSLPSELPLSQIGDPANGSNGEDSGPEELPLSPRSEGAVAAEHHGVASDTASRPNPVSGAAASASASRDASLAGGDAMQQSIFARKGRPNKTLQEAMRRALEDAGGGVAHGLGGLQPRVSGTPASSSEPPESRLARERDQIVVRELVRLNADQLKSAIGKRPRHGIRPQTPVVDALIACATLAEEEPGKLDEEALVIANFLLGEQRVALASKRVRGESLSVDPKRLSLTTPRLASALVAMENGARLALEKCLANNARRQDLLLYLDWCSYDETPLPVTLRGGSGKDSQEGEIISGSTTKKDALALDLAPKSVLTPRLSTKQGLQKVLQTAQRGAIVLRLHGTVVSVFSTTICPLVVLSRTTAAAMREALLRLSGVTLAARLFQHRVRAAIVDAYSANLLAEQHMVKDRQDEWVGLVTPCEIHKTSSCHGRTFSLLEPNIRGMIHTALALHSGGAMDRFRSCLRVEIASRFVVKHGLLPADALRYKKGLLRLFASHGSAVSVRRTLLALCPNGDWRSESVEFYAQEGEMQLQSRVAMLEHVTVGLITALCSAQPSLYPRHRWTGADLATDSLAIFESCHRLLSTTFLRFAASFEPLPRAQQLLALGQRLAFDRVGPDNMAHQGHLFGGIALADAPAGTEQVEGNDAALAADSGGAQAAGPPSESTDWAVVNATHRKIAVQWLLGRPLSTLILQRQVMEPLRHLLARQFEVAGQSWERRQQAKVAQALSQGLPGIGAREYALELAASCKEEERVFEQTVLLFEGEALWASLSPDAFTVAFRAKAFSCIARMACAVKQLLHHPHRQAPFQTFRLLSEPDIADSLLETPPCRLDAWTRSLIEHHPTLRGQECLSKVEAVACVQRKDTSNIEAKHASIRRLVTAASVQTHQASMADVSAEYCCLQFRKRREGMPCGKGKRSMPRKKAARWAITGYRTGAGLNFGQEEVCLFFHKPSILLVGDVSGVFVVRSPAR